MKAPDIDAMEDRIVARLIGLTNEFVAPTEPLVRDVFLLDDERMENDNFVHPLPSVGVLHDDEPWKGNDVLGGGYASEGNERWFLLVMCDSPKRGQGMRGPRGARSIAGQIMDSFNGWPVDAEDGKCPMETRQRKRFLPREAGFMASCGYILILENPVSIDEAA